jgi:hypothetical protein
MRTTTQCPHFSSANRGPYTSTGTSPLTYVNDGQIASSKCKSVRIAIDLNRLYSPIVRTNIFPVAIGFVMLPFWLHLTTVIPSISTMAGGAGPVIRSSRTIFHGLGTLAFN